MAGCLKVSFGSTNRWNHDTKKIIFLKKCVRDLCRIFQEKQKKVGYSANLPTNSFRNLREKNLAGVLFQISYQKSVPENGQRSRGFAPPIRRPDCDDFVLPG